MGSLKEPRTRRTLTWPIMPGGRPSCGYEGWGVAPSYEPWRNRSAGLASDFHQFKVLFAGAAFGTDPVRRHVFPAGAGCNAFVGEAGLFVIDPATNQTHPSTHSSLLHQIPTRFPAAGQRWGASIRMGTILPKPNRGSPDSPQNESRSPAQAQALSTWPPLLPLSFWSSARSIPRDLTACPLTPLPAPVWVAMAWRP